MYWWPGGYQRTSHNVQRMYWWPGMHMAILKYVHGCKLQDLPARHALAAAVLVVQTHTM